jgi:hypothetical protein
VAKRLSGGSRRVIVASKRKLGWPLGKAGCPKGITTKKVAQLYRWLWEDLAHELWLDPTWQGKGISDYRLAEILQKKRPERYAHLSLRALRRHVEAVESGIWDPRGKGANTLAKFLSLPPAEIKDKEAKSP